MSANRFGHLFQITSFGESHGPALGVVIEGCPAGVSYDEKLLMSWLERRRPGAGAAVSARQELDQPEILSGVFEGRTLGTPITVVVRNQDARSQDYTIEPGASAAAAKPIAPRAGHADDVWREKFGHSDYRGGGRSSGRETLARVIGGAFAQMFLREATPNLEVIAQPRSIGTMNFQVADYDSSAPYRLADKKRQELEAYLLRLKSEGDSVGGVAEVRVANAPKNLGQPVFHKLKADLAAALMSIGAVTGVELGEGFALAAKRGQEVHTQPDAAAYGGIRGGISTGEPIVLRAAFKPTSSILDVAKRGRHDPCIVLRALPVLEAMAYLVLADHLLWSRLDRV